MSEMECGIADEKKWVVWVSVPKVGELEKEFDDQEEALTFYYRLKKQLEAKLEGGEKKNV